MATTSIGAPGVVFPDGTTQASASPGNVITRIYTSPGTTPSATPWTKPSDLKAVRVTICSGGGSSGYVSPALPVVAGRAGAGGAAGYGYFQAPAIPGPLTVTVGAGGNAAPYGPGAPAAAGITGGTSSFGALVSATGGAGGAAGSSPTPVAGGTITPSSSVWGVPGYASSVSVGGDSGLGFGQGGTGPGVAGKGYGGGAGGTNNSTTIISGAAGIIIVEEFY